MSPKLVLIGVSTGGPPRLRELLAALPPDLPVPLVVAQHIAPGFGRGFATWLGDSTRKSTVYVDRRMHLQPGVVHVAPDDGDLVVDKRLRVSPLPPSSVRGTPSVDLLFKSAAASVGAETVSILMTGMGSDGAAGTQELARVGATTWVQDPRTCAVSSMPESAIRAAEGVAVLEPAAMPTALSRLLHERASEP